MQYEAVVFDLFGTLVPNFEPEAYAQCVAAMAGTLGAEEKGFDLLWSKETYQQRMTGAFETVEAHVCYICERMGIAASEAQIAEATRIRFEYTRRALVARSDSVATFERLKSAGLRLALVSDCSYEAPILWPHTPLARFFDVTVFSCIAKMKKPDPRIYQLACDELVVPPSACVYVGDGFSQELDGAAAVGMTPVLITPPNNRFPASSGNIGDDWAGLRIDSPMGVCAILGL